MDIFNYAFNIKELMILFGVLQTLFLVTVLVHIPTQNLLPNRLLSGLLICLSLLLVEYIWVYSQGFKITPYFLGFSLPFCLIISPLYYLYAKTLLQENPGWRTLLHGLPSLMGLMFLIPFYLADPLKKIEWVEQAIGTGIDAFPAYGILVASFISIHMLVYFYSTYALVENYETKVKEESADVGVLTISWLNKLSMVFCVFAVLFYLSAMKYLMLPTNHDVLPNLLAFSVVTFILVLAYYTYKQPDLFALYDPGKLPLPEELEHKPKYQNTLLSTDQVNQYKEKLLMAMEKDEYYLEGGLRLVHLAESLTIPAHHLSQVINVAFEQSFFDFINHYRVTHAKGMLSQSDGIVNILEIALASGFNSKASFNRVFKRDTGVTPSAFLLKSQNS
ncbi:helix-turn-helix domain-containing protein [Gammaproteobacteria bacterium]|nr:helix-turn-helix domain-containing protein [Gammaproteobacteria bacterium]